MNSTIKLILAIPVVMALSLVAGTFLYEHFAYADDVAKNKLLVTFNDNTAPSYKVFVNSDEQYTLNQKYSWVRDLTSRYSIASYSIDGGEQVEIARKARGNFTLDISMDSPHVVAFFAVPQFSIGVNGVSDFTFFPPSPTGDYWFDQNSKITVEVPKTIEFGEKTRQQLTTWSLDNSETIPIPRDEKDVFNTPPIIMSDEHNLTFTNVTQYKVEMSSEYGATSGEGWYDSGTTAYLGVVYPTGFFSPTLEGWEGSDIEQDGNFAQLLVTSPAIIKLKWTADYSKIVLVGLVSGGIGLGLFIKYSRRAKNKTTTQAREPVIDNASLDSYSKEIGAYFYEKSLEKANKIRESGLITEEKYRKIKEKLEYEMIHQ